MIGEATTRKVNEMVKRARTLRAHILILDYLRQQMPVFGHLFPFLTLTFAFLFLIIHYIIKLYYIL